MSEGSKSEKERLMGSETQTTAHNRTKERLLVAVATQQENFNDFNEKDLTKMTAQRKIFSKRFINRPYRTV
jgi:hypothetical protein